MDNFEDELRTKWNMINNRSGGSLRLAVSHPLDWYVRYATPELKSVVAVSNRPVINMPPSKSIDTACNQRKDGKYAISFTLTERKQEDVFIAMTGDIIEFSQAATSDDALKKMVKRYNAWRQLLDHRHSALLSMEAQKGLIGELLYLKERLELGTSPRDAISGWTGPEGADQDFSYDDGWHEIKAVGVAASDVSISSVEQLDSDLAGEFVIYRIDKCAPAQTGAFTLYQLVHVVMELLVSDYEATESFLLKLGSVGYIDMRDYDKQNFRFSSRQTYIVEGKFPRIRREDIATEITNAQYQISLPSIENWHK